LSSERRDVDRTLRMAYADPPYVGQSKRHYGDHEDYAGEVDHGELIDRLLSGYPDGWALSISSPSTQMILALLGERGLSQINGDFRLTAWIKPFAAFKRNVRVAYAWEPIILKPAPRLEGATPTRDFIEDLAMFDLDLAVREPITMRKGFTGAKPEKVCTWLFEALGLRPCDELVDLYLGSGAVGRAWEAWRGRGEIADPESGRLVV
jgi:hypothetical protein